MLIAQISDSHIELPEPQGAGRIRDFERVVSDINKLPVLPDMVIHTGDVTHCNKPVEYKFARSILKRLMVPFHIIPGNKDERAAMGEIFGLEKPFNHDSVDTGPVRLILLDTLSDTSGKGAMCGKRLDWLRDRLAETDKPVLVFMHHPPYHIDGVKYPFQFESKDVVSAFEQVVRDAGNVAGIFCGHAHRNTAGMAGGARAMTVTSISIERRKGDYPAEMADRPVYRLIEVDESGQVSTRLQVCR